MNVSELWGERLRVLLEVDDILSGKVNYSELAGRYAFLKDQGIIEENKARIGRIGHGTNNPSPEESAVQYNI